MANRTQYDEGGWGWFVVLACFVSEFVVFGTLKALGILITPMKEDLSTDLWIMGSISVLHIVVHYILSPPATLLARKHGGRPVIISGGVLFGLGFVLASTTNNLVVLSTGIIGLAGTGSACVTQTTRGEIAFYFKEKYPVAICVVLIGGLLGISLYGPITQVFLETYGWRGAMLLLGGLGFNLVWAGALVRRPKPEYQGVSPAGIPSDDDQEEEYSEGTRAESNGKGNWSLMQALGLNIFSNFEFTILASIRMFFNLTYNGFVVYMVPMALATGLTSREASFLTTALGVGSFAGLLVGTYVARYNILAYVAIIPVSFVTAVFLAVDPLIQSSFVGQLAITFAIGVGINCVLGVVAVLPRRLPFGDDSIGVINGWMAFLSGAASAVGDILLGWVYDVSSSFFCAFLLLSVSTAAVILCSIVELLHIHSSKKRKR